MIRHRTPHEAFIYAGIGEEDTKKIRQLSLPYLCGLVGAAGFELATPCTPCKCATRLRYAPTQSAHFIVQKNIFQTQFFSRENDCSIWIKIARFLTRQDKLFVAKKINAQGFQILHGLID